MSAVTDNPLPDRRTVTASTVTADPATADTDADPVVEQPRDAGFSLVENVVAVVLLGFIASAILVGMWTVIRVSSFSDDQAKVVSVLGSASDRVANFDYDPCPVTADGENIYEGIAKGAAGAVDWVTSSVTVTEMRYWQPGTGWTTENGLAGGSCNPGSGLSDSRTMQKVTLTVTAPSGKYARSVEVVKTPVRPDYNPANDPANTP